MTLTWNRHWDYYVRLGGLQVTKTSGGTEDRDRHGEETAGSQQNR